MLSKNRDGRSRRVCISQRSEIGFGEIYAGIADWAKYPGFLGCFLYVVPNSNVKTVKIKWSMEGLSPVQAKRGKISFFAFLIVFKVYFLESLRFIIYCKVEFSN